MENTALRLQRYMYLSVRLAHRSVSRHHHKVYVGAVAAVPIIRSENGADLVQAVTVSRLCVDNKFKYRLLRVLLSKYENVAPRPCYFNYESTYGSHTVPTPVSSSRQHRARLAFVSGLRTLATPHAFGPPRALRGQA